MCSPAGQAVKLAAVESATVMYHKGVLEALAHLGNSARHAGTVHRRGAALQQKVNRHLCSSATGVLV